MALWYVWDQGDNSPGYGPTDRNDPSLADNWSNAFQSLATAITSATPGTDLILVAHDHQETSSTADIRFTGPVTVPSQVIVRVNRTTGAYDKTDTTYNFVTTTGNYEVDFDGSFAIYGIRVHSNEKIYMDGGGGDEQMYCQDCHFRIGSNQAFYGGNATLVNCTIDAQDDSTRGGAIVFVTGSGDITIIGGAITGSAQSDVVTRAIKAEFCGVDMTGLASGTALVDNRAAVDVKFIKCRMPANFVFFVSGTQDDNLDSYVELYQSDADAGNKKYNVQAASGHGDLSTETTIIRSGGFVDKSTSQGCSWEVVTTVDAGGTVPSEWMF